MEQGFKERLVGAAVLVAIAVWLIPWVLDGPEAPLEASGSSLRLPPAEEPMPMRTQTLRLGAAEPEVAVAPPTPAAAPPAETVAAVVPPPQTEEAKAPETTTAEPPAVAAARPEPAPEPPAAAPASPPPAAPAPAPKAAVAAAPAAGGDWIVQLGSFSDEANARRLAQRSATFGYKADVSSYRSGSKTLYRVRVGPPQSRAKADAAASALKAHGIKEASVVAAR
jgi:DedD protein